MAPAARAHVSERRRRDGGGRRPALALARSFLRHVGTFLAKTRSVPSIIESCFGKDPGIQRIERMRDWWDSLKADEQKRRGIFSDQFRDDRKAFRGHYLTNARDVSEHRLCFPNTDARGCGPYRKTNVRRT